MPKKRLTNKGLQQSHLTAASINNKAADTSMAASGHQQSSNSKLTLDMQHTVTAFYQHLNDKKASHVNEIDQLNSIIRPQKVAQHQQEQERIHSIHKSLLQKTQQQTAKTSSVSDAMGFAH